MTSTHYRRRWFYALWSTLLLLSLFALYKWETPVRSELASLQVTLTVTGAPPGTRVQAWAGPWKKWPGPGWAGDRAFGDLVLPASGPATLPTVRLPIAWRRWGLGYIPRGTWDLVMVKVTPPSGPPRYLPIPCSRDILTGFLRPRFKGMQFITASWQNLSIDGNSPNRVP